MSMTRMYKIVGGVLVGDKPADNVVVSTKKKRKCGVCRNEGCKGLGGHQYCDKFNSQDGIIVHKMKIRHQKVCQCQLCIVWGGHGLKQHDRKQRQEVYAFSYEWATKVNNELKI